ncbi:MAG: hypothetical protein J6X70_00265, partial [Muribaculaceae bacterium]|nr:hypothetical protein [Muribaculaceae bacterium]
MKKVTLTLALCVSLGAAAQVLNVTGIEPLTLPEGTSKVTAISQQGDYVLLTNDVNQGLTKLNLTNGAVQRVTDAAGAGYDVKLSADGQNVVYRETSYTKKHLRKTAVSKR